MTDQIKHMCTNCKHVYHLPQTDKYLCCRFPPTAHKITGGLAHPIVNPRMCCGEFSPQTNDKSYYEIEIRLLEPDGKGWMRPVLNQRQRDVHRTILVEAPQYDRACALIDTLANLGRDTLDGSGQ